MALYCARNEQIGKVFLFSFLACCVPHTCSTKPNAQTIDKPNATARRPRCAHTDAYMHNLPRGLCGCLSKLAPVFDRQHKPRRKQDRRAANLPAQTTPKNHEAPHELSRQRQICISKNDKKGPTPHQKRHRGGNDPLKNSRHNFSSDFFLQDFF